MLRTLIEQFERTNRRRKLLRWEDAVVVAVSGGADSMALLEFLKKLERKYSLKLRVAHLDHTLQSGKRARELVKAAAKKHGLPLHLKKADVRGLARREKLSLEDAGRRERYRFFEEVAKKTRSTKIATAHTLDDQAETILMRLVRGSGLRGLAGIPAERPQGRFTVIRPLLGCHKKDLRSFLKEEGVSFVEDPMNDDPAFFRNQVRHALLPLLVKRFNPRIKEGLANLGGICAEAEEHLEGRRERAFRRCLKEEGRSQLALDAGRLKRLAPGLRREVLADAVRHLKGDLTGFGYAHWEAADALIDSGEDGLETHWPHRFRVRKTGGKLVISSRKR